MISLSYDLPPAVNGLVSDTLYSGQEFCFPGGGGEKQAQASGTTPSELPLHRIIRNFQPAGLHFDRLPLLFYVA